MGDFAHSNLMHMDVYRGGTALEADVIQMVVSLFNGDSECCGVTTSGGTESILTAIYAYREWGRAVKGISRANIVAPRTAHVAFDKACTYLGVEYRELELNNDLTAEAADFEAAMDENTIALVVGAPSFPHGVFDPVQEVARLARNHNVGCHVDACLGGFMSVFMEEAGYDVMRHDFRVPGVTTISADTHKYGLGPKGCSTLLYRTHELRRFQYYHSVKWMGGVYTTSGIAGSRSAAPVAGTWVQMMLLGREGYVANVKRVVETTRRVRGELQKIQDIELIGPNDMFMNTFTSKRFNPISISDYLSKRGWSVNALQHPYAIHVTWTDANCHQWNNFCLDLKSIVEEMHKNPSMNKTDKAAMYATNVSISDPDMISQFTYVFADEILTL